MMIKDNIQWGIIGCGDVTEVKSGPAFHKVAGSRLVAVMRRDAAKAADYAHRHGVPKWYDDASALIADPDVNAIYVATPPSSHEQYALAAIAAGKPVYLEKPMTLNVGSAARIVAEAGIQQVKVCIAHYRRAQPLFNRVKEMIEGGSIGKVRLVHLELNKPPMSAAELANPGKAWRLNPEIAGGGLFHDLSPHQLDILLYYFGEVAWSAGCAAGATKKQGVPDTVTGTILFKSGVAFAGSWCFAVAAGDEKDQCTILGDQGSIRFSFFENRPVELHTSGEVTRFDFEPLQHVQQPMIEQVVRYFGGQGPNPCSAEEGLATMHLIDSFSASGTS